MSDLADLRFKLESFSLTPSAIEVVVVLTNLLLLVDLADFKLIFIFLFE